MSNFILIALSILLLAFLIAAAKRKIFKKVWLRRLVNVTAIIAIVVMVLTVALFPDLPGVKTMGEFAYTVQTLELADNSRVETYKDDGSFRKLSVLVYSPETAEKCPLIVFSHGGISTNTSNVSLYAELASRGYVVAAISHTYHAISTKIDGKSIFINSAYMRELNTENSYENIENSYELFQKWMALRTDDISFVIDYFAAGGFAIVDAERIGVAGHSLGGSAALGVARQRSDVSAVLALESPFMSDITGVDGGNFVWNTAPYDCAVMNIYSDSGYPLLESDNKYVQNKNYLYNSGNVEYYYIEGSNHYSLCDLVRMSPLLCQLLGGGYEKSGYDTLAFINEKSAAFFDKYLRD
ncbi:MAG: prolyl oligopeptidase family serine peptidase [Oscillospiraceae bacterium]|jgi:pimeloyl-ACP methyl ester carboxylesterase|nr:prolyl oligopeptidase family serine peptidase [Oscillospiraceae bacterium]